MTRKRCCFVRCLMFRALVMKDIDMSHSRLLRYCTRRDREERLRAKVLLMVLESSTRMGQWSGKWRRWEHPPTRIQEARTW